jgi:hypothetical protein
MKRKKTGCVGIVVTFLARYREALGSNLDGSTDNSVVIHSFHQFLQKDAENYFDLPTLCPFNILI